jgi:PAS domain S-box-containing protein
MSQSAERLVQPPGDDDAPASRGAVRAQTVFIIDDDDNLALALSAIVTHEGHRARCFSGGTEALVEMRAELPDLVLLDLAMPDMDGVDVLRAIRADSRLASVPVAMVTGSFADATLTECFELGIVDLIRKPFHRAETRLRISAQLRLATAQRRSRHAAEELEAISRAAKDAIIVIDDRGLVTHWNPAAEAMFGYAPGEALGKNMHALLSPERYIPAHAASFQTFRALGEGPAVGRTVELSAKCKSGDEIPVELSLSATRLDGRWCGVGIVRDMQGRKSVEAELRLLHMAVEQSPASVVITNTTGTIEYVNRKFTDVTGYTLEEVRGKNPRVLKSGSTPKGTYDKLWETVAEGRTWSGQFCNRRKDGSEFWEQVSISPVRAVDSEVTTHYIALKEDITARRALEVQLLNAQKLETIGQLAAGIAHEINTPTQFVSDNVRFLDEAMRGLLGLVDAYRAALEPLAAEPAHAATLAELRAAEEAADLDYVRENGTEAVAMSLDGLSRIARIVGAMKDFSHPGQKDKAPADLNAAMRSTVIIAANEYKYVATVTCELGELPRVPCLVGELNQVFLVLIVNAAHAIADVVKASGEKGSITIRSVAVEDGVEISVSDTGSGVPEAIKHRIFDPFFTTKPVGKGTGQGLAIAHAIVVTKHGGRLTFTSEVGLGTTFTVWLPLHPESVGPTTR